MGPSPSLGGGDGTWEQKQRLQAWRTRKEENWPRFQIFGDSDCPSMKGARNPPHLLASLVLGSEELCENLPKAAAVGQGAGLSRWPASPPSPVTAMAGPPICSPAGPSTLPQQGYHPLGQQTGVLGSSQRPACP